MEIHYMADKNKNNGKEKMETGLTTPGPVPIEIHRENPKLRRLTDDEIIQGFRYLMNKDRDKR